VGSIPIHPRQTFLEGLFRGKLNTETGPRGRFSSFQGTCKTRVQEEANQWQLRE
jgi:hypothetical protein